jgi:serine protease AprX
MVIAKRGAGNGNRAGLRFGSRWDDGQRPKRSLLPLVAISVALLAAPAAHARPMPLAPAPVDVVVVAKPARVDAAERLTVRLGGTVGRPLEIVDGFTASVPRCAIKRLERSPAVRAVSRDGALDLKSDPGAEAAAASTAVLRTATGADASTFDGAGVGVALLDSGAVDVGGLGRPGALVRGPDFSAEGGDRRLAGLDTFGHGTHLAGLISGHDPLSGFQGIAPGARVVSVKVAGADGVTSLAQVLAGMEWVRQHRADPGLNIRVLNLSLGTSDEADYRRDVLAWAAEQLWKDGIAVVAAAGNEGADADALDMPAADPYVIAVGATDTGTTPDPADDRVADFSSRSALRGPDVVAPGTGVVSLRVPGSTLDEEFPGARVGDGFFRGSGTSQAAAVVSGLAARLLSQRPELTNDQLKALLQAGAVDLADPASADGSGRVDVGRSEALATPDARAAQQKWPASVPDLKRLFKRGKKELDAGAASWSGRRWSGMKWAGRRWSGMKWAGMKWNGEAWEAAR